MIDLRDMLEAAGVQGMHETSKELVGRCPGHFERTGHEDRKPSWSVNKSTYVHFCFSCGYKGTLSQLLTDLTGAAPVDLVDELRKQSFLSRMAVRENPEETLEPVISEWAITHLLDDVPEKLLAMRYLMREAIDAYQVRWNRDTRQWVLPVWSTSGDLLGAQYRQQGSVLTLPKGMAKSSTVFGYEVVKPFDYAVLVESPLDAVRLFGLGIPAFATLGAWVSKEQVTLMARCFSYVIMALDNDDAGRQGTEVATSMLRKRGCAAIDWDYTDLVDVDGLPAKDVGDVPHDDCLLAAFDRTMNFGDERVKDLTPYAGTSGWTSTGTSRKRSAIDDSTGLNRQRHEETMALLAAAGRRGRTHGEIENQMGRVVGWHHGVVSGALTRGRRIKEIYMLAETRGKEGGRSAHVHVHKDYLDGRPFLPYRPRSLPKALRAIKELLLADEVDEALEYIEEVLAPPEVTVVPSTRKRIIPRQVTH